MRKWLTRVLALLLLGATPALAQQTGTIQGEVTSAAGERLSGVVVAATSDVLPQARQAVSGANGDYRLPLLPPGTYQVSFSLEGMATVKKSVQVALQQTATVDASLSIDAVSEEIVVVGTSSLVNTSSAELHASVTRETIAALPVGQEYRDLVKLIPGVQYTEDSVRGPSAGGSGQDNTYLFDGVNVTLPLFGTLSAEPSAHDIDQVAVVKGGANAVDFNRAGGFLMNSISRSGTNAFHASLTLPGAAGEPDGRSRQRGQLCSRRTRRGGSGAWAVRSSATGCISTLRTLRPTRRAKAARTSTARCRTSRATATSSSAS